MSDMNMSFSLAKSILRDVTNSSINSCGMFSFHPPRTTSNFGKAFNWPTSQAVFPNSLSKLTESADVDSTSWERNQINPSSLSISSSCATKELMGTLAPWSLRCMTPGSLSLYAHLLGFQQVLFCRQVRTFTTPLRGSHGVEYVVPFRLEKATSPPNPA